MNPWFWILIGILASPLVALVGLLIGWAFLWAVAWFSWKRRQIRLRAEWTEANPYWREAFEAGAKWAREGDPRAEPNLTQLRMPKEPDS